MGEGAGMDVEAEEDDALPVSKADVEAFEGVYKGSAAGVAGEVMEAQRRAWCTAKQVWTEMESRDD